MLGPEPASADFKARRQAQQEFALPLVVEAGAGTGKTATLVARILAWALGPGWERSQQRVSSVPDRNPEERDRQCAATTLSRIVAMTFTEAAAAEMGERLAAGLEKIADGGAPVGWLPPELTWEQPVSPEDLRHRATCLREAADQLQVRTIHSFCRWLLAAYPIEAGLHPDFVVDADGSELRRVTETIVEAKLPAAYTNLSESSFLALAARGYGPVEIAGLVEDLAAEGLDAKDLAEEPFSADRYQELVDRLWDAVNQLLTLLEMRRLDTADRHSRKVLSGLAGLRRGLRTLRRRADPDFEALRDLAEEHCSPATMERLRLWAHGETTNRRERERLAGLAGKLREVAHPLRQLLQHVRGLDPELLSHARAVALELLKEVRRELWRRGFLTFADLLRRASELLARHPEVLGQVRRRFDQVLVDEFQDTDAGQCDLIRRLALTGPIAERPGLFVVGDPQQSIYGWRKADLRAYESFVGTVLDSGGFHTTLDDSFRSRPEILEEVARVIAPVMRRVPGIQPEFRPLRACREVPEEDSEGGRAVVEHWVAWGGDEEPELVGARRTATIEARALVKDLKQSRAEGILWSDVAVLMRSTTDLEIYLAEMREAEIPFIVSRDRQYYRRREVIEAAALVRVVLARDDHLALLIWLRSVAVGVPDAALLPLWQGGLPQLFAGENLEAVADLVEKVTGQLPTVPGIERVQGWQEQLVYAFQTIQERRAEFARLPADVFVERLRLSFLDEATAAARYLGAYRLANLDRFFAELETALVQEGGDRHRVLRRLRRRVREGFEAEEARPRDRGEEAVQVMTIHKAKGLEFRHVYLVQTHKEAGRRQWRGGVEFGREGERFEYRLWGAPTPGFDLLARRREELERAELVRTLYVALTRPSERLVVLGRRPFSEARNLADVATHMDLLVHRHQGPSWTALVEQWRQGENSMLVDDVLWVMPGRPESDRPQGDKPYPRDAEEPTDTSSSTLGSGLPSREVIQGQAIQGQMIQGRRAASELRMDAPFRRVARRGLRFSGGDSARAALNEFLQGLEGSMARDLSLILPPENGTLGYEKVTVDCLYQEDTQWVLGKLIEGQPPVSIQRSLRRAGEALQEELGLARAPRCELWRMVEGKIEVVDSGGPS